MLEASLQTQLLSSPLYFMEQFLHFLQKQNIVPE